VVDVHPKVTGFMVKINVDIGDRVRKGQTLAVLEVPELNAQLKGTVFEVQRAKDDCCARRTRSSGMKRSIRRFTPTMNGCSKHQRPSQA
jgi:multidrug resistance efflux pump